MASNICQGLVDKTWEWYSNLHKVPEAEGIYAIGDETGSVVYVGHSENMQTSLRQHKSPPQDIDEFVKKEIADNGGVNLRIKWIEDPDHKCAEGEYFECLEKKLEYRPKYNKNAGNKSH